MAAVINGTQAEHLGLHNVDQDPPLPLLHHYSDIVSSTHSDTCFLPCPCTCTWSSVHTSHHCHLLCHDSRFQVCSHGGSKVAASKTVRVQEG
jgi:hypothetical protein